MSSQGISSRRLNGSFNRAMSVRGGWACDTCTYENDPMFLACDMCGQPRPKAAEPETTGGISAERLKEIAALQAGLFDMVNEEDDKVNDFALSFVEGGVAHSVMSNNNDFQQSQAPAEPPRNSIGMVRNSTRGLSSQRGLRASAGAASNRGLRTSNRGLAAAGQASNRGLAGHRPPSQGTGSDSSHSESELVERQQTRTSEASMNWADVRGSIQNKKVGTDSNNTLPTINSSVSQLSSQNMSFHEWQHQSNNQLPPAANTSPGVFPIAAGTPAARAQERKMATIMANRPSDDPALFRTSTASSEPSVGLVRQGTERLPPHVGAVAGNKNDAVAQAQARKMEAVSQAPPQVGAFAGSKGDAAAQAQARKMEAVSSSPAAGNQSLPQVGAFAGSKADAAAQAQARKMEAARPSTSGQAPPQVGAFAGSKGDAAAQAQARKMEVVRSSTSSQVPSQVGAFAGSKSDAAAQAQARKMETVSSSPASPRVGAFAGNKSDAAAQAQARKMETVSSSPAAGGQPTPQVGAFAGSKSDAVAQAQARKMEVVRSSTSSQASSTQVGAFAGSKSDAAAQAQTRKMESVSSSTNSQASSPQVGAFAGSKGDAAARAQAEKMATVTSGSASQPGAMQGRKSDAAAQAQAMKMTAVTSGGSGPSQVEPPSTPVRPGAVAGNQSDAAAQAQARKMEAVSVGSATSTGSRPGAVQGRSGDLAAAAQARKLDMHFAAAAALSTPDNNQNALELEIQIEDPTPSRDPWAFNDPNAPPRRSSDTTNTGTKPQRHRSTDSTSNGTGTTPQRHRSSDGGITPSRRSQTADAGSLAFHPLDFPAELEETEPVKKEKKHFSFSRNEAMRNIQSDQAVRNIGSIAQATDNSSPPSAQPSTNNSATTFGNLYDEKKAAKGKSSGIKGIKKIFGGKRG